MRLALLLLALAMLSFWLTGTSAEKKSEQEPSTEAAPAEPNFEMVKEGTSPYPLTDRKDLSVNCGGGKGVLISPRWVLTASHCITSGSQADGKVSVNFSGEDGKERKIGVEKVVRHPNKDLALLLLKRPVTAKERDPVLLLRAPLLEKDGKLKIKKVAGNAVWRDIPGIGKNDNLSVPNKEERQGKAGTSGGPWLLHSPQVGDVLIGITHGSGLAPQVGWVAKWIQETVQAHGADRLVWATKQQALGQ